MRRARGGAPGRHGSLYLCGGLRAGMQRGSLGAGPGEKDPGGFDHTTASALLEGGRFGAKGSLNGRPGLCQGAAATANIYGLGSEHLVPDSAQRRATQSHFLLGTEGELEDLRPCAAYALSRRGDGIQSHLSRWARTDAAQCAEVRLRLADQLRAQTAVSHTEEQQADRDGLLR